jgi:putative FmdB family regulatory protein
MPIYKLECKKCHKKFEKYTSIVERSENLIQCPKCNSNEMNIYFGEIKKRWFSKFVNCIKEYYLNFTLIVPIYFILSSIILQLVYEFTTGCSVIYFYIRLCIYTIHLIIVIVVFIYLLIMIRSFILNKGKLSSKILNFIKNQNIKKLSDTRSNLKFKNICSNFFACIFIIYLVILVIVLSYHWIIFGCNCLKDLTYAFNHKYSTIEGTCLDVERHSKSQIITYTINNIKFDTILFIDIRDGDKCEITFLPNSKFVIKCKKIHTNTH